MTTRSNLTGFAQYFADVWRDAAASKYDARPLPRSMQGSTQVPDLRPSVADAS